MQFFLDEFCNWSKPKRVFLTFDIDWAPDYMITYVLRLLKEANAQATIFATHHSPLLQALSDSPRIELGLHPNLLPNSSQGADFKTIMPWLKSRFPKAIGNRFHVLKYSYRELLELKNYGLRYDVSTIRFNCPYLVPAWHNDLKLNLLTYCWEDGICENGNLPMSLDSLEIDTPGMKIINFHPMNVFINSSNKAHRHEFLNAAGPLLECPEDIAKAHQQSRPGAANVLRALLREISRQNIESGILSELSEAYGANKKKEELKCLTYA